MAEHGAGPVRTDSLLRRVRSTTFRWAGATTLLWLLIPTPVAAKVSRRSRSTCRTSGRKLAALDRACALVGGHPAKLIVRRSSARWVTDEPRFHAWQLSSPQSVLSSDRL